MYMFGERLRLLRKAHKLTQATLAEKLKTAKSTISQYENSVNEPDYDTLLKVSEIFQVSTDYLLGKTEEASTLNQQPSHSIEPILSILTEDEKEFLLESLRVYRDVKGMWGKG